MMPQEPSVGEQRDKNIAAWYEEQRRLYKDGRLSPAEISQLEAIKDWTWETTMPDGYETVERPATNTAEWYEEQKRRYRDGKLSPAEIKQLEFKKGWSWELDKPEEGEGGEADASPETADDGDLEPAAAEDMLKDGLGTQEATKEAADDRPLGGREDVREGLGEESDPEEDAIPDDEALCDPLHPRHEFDPDDQGEYEDQPEPTEGHSKRKKDLFPALLKKIASGYER